MGNDGLADQDAAGESPSQYEVSEQMLCYRVVDWLREPKRFGSAMAARDPGDQDHHQQLDEREPSFPSHLLSLPKGACPCTQNCPPPAARRCCRRPSAGKTSPRPHTLHRPDPLAGYTSSCVRYRRGRSEALAVTDCNRPSLRSPTRQRRDRGTPTEPTASSVAWQGILWAGRRQLSPRPGPQGYIVIITMMEPAGLEPATSGVRCRRSPS